MIIDDEWLKCAASEYAQVIIENLQNPKEYKHEFSDKFEKNMKYLIDRTNFSESYRFGKKLASILLILFVGAGVFISINTQAQEKILRWLRYHYDNFYEYIYEGTQDNILDIQYTLSWLPKDCELVETFKTAGGETSIYTDSIGTLIMFSYTYSNEENLYIEMEDCREEVVKINDGYGIVYLNENEERTNSIVWTDETKEVLFEFSGKYSKDELLRIAEGVTKVENVSE